MPAYHFIYPMLDLKFKGRIAYLRESVDNEFVVSIGQANSKRYLTVHAEELPRGKIIDKLVDARDALQAITTYIANHFKKRFIRFKKGFVDRNAPMQRISVHYLNSSATLAIYRGFESEYYLREANKWYLLRVSIVPIFEFELEITVIKIIQNLHARNKELIISQLEGVHLNTVREYWQKKPKLKPAGEFVNIYFPGEKSHKEKINKIKKYYSEKGTLDQILEIYKRRGISIDKDIVVVTKKKRGNERIDLDYLGELLVPAPSIENLANYLESKELKSIFLITRPKKPESLKNLLKKTLEMYTKNLPPLIEIERNYLDDRA